MALCLFAASCGCGNDKKNDNDDFAYVDDEDLDEDEDESSESHDGKYTDVKEEVWEEYGNRNIRIEGDKTISHPELMKDKKKCFIVMSKKDYYLYVYEAQGKDTVMLARYDCCFSRKKGQKEKSGDMKTPHCSLDEPFSISEIVDASDWKHDFGDGRGEILSYGNYFHRLVTPGHKGIGIHGSTNNVESVPGRASEGCIRLHDEDLDDLHDNYTFVGMKVVIKAEEQDDYPFEARAMKNQNIARKRHLDPRKTLTNQQVEQSSDVHRANGTSVSQNDIPDDEMQPINPSQEFDESEMVRENLTIEELKARRHL